MASRKKFAIHIIAILIDFYGSVVGQFGQSYVRYDSLCGFAFIYQTTTKYKYLLKTT